jgi:hypothetical protein
MSAGKFIGGVGRICHAAVFFCNCGNFEEPFCKRFVPVPFKGGRWDDEDADCPD